MSTTRAVSRPAARSRSLPRRSRRLLGAAAAVLCLGGLAACSSDDDTQATDPGSSTSPDSGSGGGADAPERDAPADAPSCTYTADTTSPAAKPVDLPPDKAVVTGSVDATLETSVGTINAELDGENAPCTVNSFVSLADQGYFDATTCHRLTGGGGLSVLQCGDPTATGRGGPGYAFDDELTGEETYPAGTLAMANAGENTNGSQFFIVYADSQLPPSYTVFGTVDQASIDLVQKVADAGTDQSNGPGDGKPNTPVDISKVTVAQ